MRIGEFAEAAGTTAKTLRFYEEQGLLPPPDRTSSGYRDYPPDAIARVDFVHRGQAAGLTLAQIRTLDCGTRRPANPADDPFVGTQQPVPGTRMPTLDEVFRLAERDHADGVRFNIETKLDPTQPQQTADPLTFTNKVIQVIRRHHAIDRSTLQSFDWRSL